MPAYNIYMKLGNIQQNHSVDLFLYIACPPVGQKKNSPEPKLQKPTSSGPLLTLSVCVSVLVC